MSTRRRVACEKRARVAAELVVLVQRDAPRCACERAPTPLPCTSARSRWLCSLLLGRSRSGRPASRWGGWLVARALSGRSVGGCVAQRGRPARGLAFFLSPACPTPPAAGQLPNEDPVYPISVSHYSPLPNHNLARTSRTRRAGAGAMGSGHGRAGVPRAAAAAAAAPSSAAFGCWRARALAR